jgi:integrase/recombinase XerD
VSFDLFIKERLYLHNVSARTIEWYEQSFKWLANPTPTDADLRDFVIRMREQGLKATSCNARIRAVNAYLRWSGSPLHISRLKEEQRVLPTFTVDQIARLAAYKPKRKYQKRLHTLVLLLADTGCRINEALSLRWCDCDFDNLLLTVQGKGRRERKVPMSFQLRRALWRFKQTSTFDDLVFCTRRGTKLGRREVLRDVKVLCNRLGIKPPERTLHAFRHAYAIHYLRKGGSVFHLQRVLGHTTLDMTRRYVNLTTEDLQKAHQATSLLADAMR